jgi:hypothetical protein
VYSGVLWCILALCDFVYDCLKKLLQKNRMEHVMSCLLMVIVNGGAPSFAVLEEVRALENCPLDEGPGERWHRLTKLAVDRASAARTPFIMASTREPQNLAIGRKYTTEYGERGKQVFRYEWINYKRVLRPTSAKAFTTMQIKNGPFFEKLYNVDFVDDGWSALITPTNSTGSDKPPPQDSNSKIRLEYLRSVLKKGEVYSVPVKKEEMLPAGGSQQVTTDQFFQVVEVEHGSSKPKLLSTYADAADTRHSTSIQIQYMEVHGRLLGNVVAFFDSDPCTINIFDVASFDDVEFRLLKWAVETSATAGCVLLVGSQRAIPIAGILDMDCPVLTILRALRRRGWKPAHLVVLHNTLAVGDFDYRQPQSKRLYYQCLLTLEDIARNNPSFISDQPNSYYLLLRQGEVTEAGLGDRAYRDRLVARNDCAAAVALLPLEAPAPPLAIEDDFETGGRHLKHDFGPNAMCDSGDGGGHGGIDARPQSSKPRPAPSHKAPSGSSSSSSSSSSSGSTRSSDSSDSSGFEVGGKRGSVSNFIIVAKGYKVKLDRYKPAGKTEYLRFIMPCPCEGHKGCERKRAANKNKKLGRIEPIAYLCAWAELGNDVSRELHCARKFPVPQELVTKWARSIGVKVDTQLDLLGI